MRYSVHDKKYKYKYFFDTKTGFYMRTGILDKMATTRALTRLCPHTHILLMWVLWDTVFMAKADFARQQEYSAIRADTQSKSLI